MLEDEAELEDLQEGRVFISYSRKDQEIAEVLRSRLRKAGFDATLDRHDIAPGEDWQKRLASLIAGAEKIVFLISPNSVKSDICAWEIEEAESQGKGILPVMVEEVDPDQVRGRLKQLNWILFRNEEERAEGFQALSEALTMDLDWERERTRINDLAKAWENTGRAKRRLVTRSARVREMEQWRDQAPQSALPPTELQLTFITLSRRSLARRQQWIAASLAAIALITAGLGVWAFLQRNQALTTESRFLARDADQERKGGSPEKGIALGLAALPVSLDNPIGRPFVDNALKALIEARYERRQKMVFQHGDIEVTSADLSPDGAMVATGGTSGSLRLWNAQTGAEIRVLPTRHQYTISTVAFSPDGKRLLTGDEVGEISIWDVTTGDKVASIDDPDNRIYRVWSAAFSPDGTKIVAGGFDGTYAEVWDSMLQNQLAVFDEHYDEILTVSFNRDGTRIASGSLDGQIFVWNAKTGETIAALQENDQPVWAASFNSDGTQIVSASRDKTVRIWSLEDASLVSTLRGHTSIVFDAEFSPDDKHILTSSHDLTARLWDVESRELKTVLGGHSKRIWVAKHSKDGRHILTASDDGSARLWDAKQGVETKLAGNHADEIWSAAFSPDGKLIATASSDTTVRLWNTVSATEEGKIIDKYGRTARALAFSPKGDRLAIGFDSNYEDNRRPVLLWTLGAKSDPIELSGLETGVWAVAFSPNGQLLATGGTDRAASIWDVNSGEKLHEFDLDNPDMDASVVGLQFSPDSAKLVAAGSEYVVVLSVEEKVKIATFPLAGLSSVAAFEIRSEGDVIAVANRQDVHIFNLETGEEVKVLRGHRASINDLSFSSDGRRILTASDDQTARLWNVATGEELARLRGFDDSVTAVAFSPDNAYMLAASKDGTARIWPHWTDVQELMASSAKIVDLLSPLTQYDRCSTFLDTVETCMDVNDADFPTHSPTRFVSGP